MLGGIPLHDKFLLVVGNLPIGSTIFYPLQRGHLMNGQK